MTGAGISTGNRCSAVLGGQLLSSSHYETCLRLSQFTTVPIHPSMVALGGCIESESVVSPLGMHNGWTL